MCAFKNYTTMLHFFYGVDGPPYQSNTESRKNLEQKFIFFKSAHSIPTVSTNVFHSTNLFLFFTLPCSYQQRSFKTLRINQVQPTIP